jgi:2-dehydro-3-deoxyphosphogluconate aldolase/(4S)-4-hydroxy-2-oxoglutarate aldolase
LRKDYPMNRTRIVEWIEVTGIIPIVRAPSADLAARAARAVLAAGIDVIEITMSVPNALGLLQQLRSEIGSHVLIGAGTVLDPKTARDCIDAGAHFIVAPGFDVQTIGACHALDKPCIPGALTPTEVITAWQAGADMVKVFPCSAVGGASYLRALKAPLPHIKLLPTGGVDVHTAADFIRSGASALGVGASVVDLKLLEQSGPAAITDKCLQLVAAVRAARG